MPTIDLASDSGEQKATTERATSRKPASKASSTPRSPKSLEFRHPKAGSSESSGGSENLSFPIIDLGGPRRTPPKRKEAIDRMRRASGTLEEMKEGRGSEEVVRAIRGGKGWRLFYTRRDDGRCWRAGGKELDLSPQVTLMLAEIQEQQSLMKTYEITMKKMEAEAERKESEISALRRKRDELVSENRSSEKKLNASGVLPLFEGFKLASLSPTHFAQVHHYALRSVRHFAKAMAREMETANWNLDEAIRFIEPRARFAKPGHRHFAIESFVARSIFEGFNFPNFGLANESSSIEERTPQAFFDQFKKLKSVSPPSFIARNPGSPLARFAKAKYLQLVHAKMECSFFGNLNHRKVVSSGGWPDSPFLAAFAEMAKRVWVLHRLAFAFGEEVGVFQVARGCRFSEVFMECVAEEALLLQQAPPPPPSADPDPDLRVGFTVVPGFKIGKTVIQCQVYLSPPASAPASS